MVPPLFSLPEELLTPRLMLRPPRAGEGAVVNEAIAETFAALQQWMPWARQLPTVQETEDFVRDAAARYHNRVDLPIFLYERDTGAFIGSSGLHPQDWSVPKLEIGYWVRASREGQGYVTEAVLGLTAAAFTYLHAEKLIIRCDSRNVRSAAVAERAGYTLEATLRRDARANDGSLRDTLQFARFAH